MFIVFPQLLVSVIVSAISLSLSLIVNNKDFVFTWLFLLLFCFFLHCLHIATIQYSTPLAFMVYGILFIFLPFLYVLCLSQHEIRNCYSWSLLLFLYTCTFLPFPFLPILSLHSSITNRARGTVGSPCQTYDALLHLDHNNTFPSLLTVTTTTTTTITNTHLESHVLQGVTIRCWNRQLRQIFLHLWGDQVSLLRHGYTLSHQGTSYTTPVASMGTEGLLVWVCPRATCVLLRGLILSETRSLLILVPQVGASP